MSQVKNLRAMFENKGDDASPPDRGRSPGPSGSTTPGASFAGSPRPLSRIRSSFVAIEKDGRMGLHRATSDDGSISKRRMSGDTDAESISAMSDNKSTTTTGDESVKPARRMFINDPIPESPRLPKDLEGSSHDIGAVTDEPSVNPDKQIDEEQPSKNLLPADPMTATAPGDSAKPVAGAEVVNGKSKAGTGSGSTGATRPTGATATKKTTARPSAISTKPGVKGAPSTKSPGVVKTPTSASSTTATKPAAKPTARTAAKTSSTATRPTASTATKSTASSAMKKPAPLKPSTSGTGFVKPKVKSPTKPVTLPPSLMAQTASSGAKTGSSRPSLTAQTGNAQPRASSRAGATTGGSKFPKAPVSKHPRPSIGPPPKRSDQQKSTARDSNVDEGFLARMMRPTAASSQKTADKAALTPPKRTAGRPSTTSSRRESSVRSSSRAKTPSVHPSEPAEDAKNGAHAVEDAAIETAIAETVEEAADIAHEVDLAPPSDELPPPAPAADAVDVTDQSTQEEAPEPEPVVEADTPDEPASVEDAVLEHSTTETVEEASEETLEQKEEVDQAQSSLAADPEAEAAVLDEPTTVDEAALEAATVETAEDAVAVAAEADLVQTPVEPEIDEIASLKQDEIALETAQVETAEDAAVIAADADLVGVADEPLAQVEEPVKIDEAKPDAEQQIVSDDHTDLPTATESTKADPEVSADDDIDTLTSKLAETRLEAGEEVAIDEEAKETR